MLRVQGADRHPHAPLCRLKAPKPGARLLAYGFPEGGDLAVVEGRIDSLTAQGGRWNAAAEFARGMSGGPVSIDGRVVAVIKGGSDDEAASRVVTPVYLAEAMIREAIGLEIMDCPPGEGEGAAVGAAAPSEEPVGAVSSTPEPTGAGMTDHADGELFKDCPFCPPMVALPSGSFLMGSPEDEAERAPDEGPQRRVDVPRVAIGAYEVTFQDWDACVKDGGCAHRPNDQGWGRGAMPVINVSWEDAQQYVAWLSEKTGEVYRLPSEAEWEYAARAGAGTPFHTGEAISTDHANFDGRLPYGDSPPGQALERTAPVGALVANDWGLYDVHGNVWEWTQDCWNRRYDGGPVDGSAWESGGDCRLAPLRGGSWRTVTRNVRLANRYERARGERGG